MKEKLISCTTLGMVIGLAFTSAQADVIFSDKFEAYSLEGFGSTRNGWALTNSVIRSGNYAAMQTLPAVNSTPQPNANLLTTARHKERGVSKGGSKYSIGGRGRARSESGLKGDLARGKNYSIQFSNKVSDPNSNSIVFQIHKRRAAGDNTGHQPLQLHVRKGHWVLSIHSNSAKGKQFDLGKIDKSKYTDWKINVKLSSGRDGSVNVSKNGKNVLNYRGPNDFKSDKGNPYVRFGVYRPAKARSGGPQTAYYDRVRVASGGRN